MPFPIENLAELLLATLALFTSMPMALLLSHGFDRVQQASSEDRCKS
ncbi:MAG: hypothetical protein AAF657_13050 [Acidobacteriota bacterium]